MNNEELKIGLGVAEWLELIKEDKNLNGAYISICQYIHLTERENQELKKQLEDITLCRDIASGHREEIQDRETILLNQQKEFIKYLEDEIKLYENDIQNFSKDYKVYFSLINDLRVIKTKIEEILQKYKETNRLRKGKRK